MRSKYIVIEGLEGAGKTTARNVVVETLEQLGIRDMVFTREPGGTQPVSYTHLTLPTICSV